MARARYAKKRKRASSYGPRKKRVTTRKIIPANRGYVRASGLYGRFGGDKELKYFDWAATATLTSILAVSFQGPITVAIGTGESQRIGRKIFLRQFHLDVYFKLFAASGLLSSGVNSVANYMRLVIVNDTQCNGTTTSWNSVFESTDLLAKRRMENEMRYNVFYDKKIKLVPPGLGAYYDSTGGAAHVVSPNVESCFEIDIDLKMPVEYDGSDGAVGTRRSNNLQVMLYSDRTHATLYKLESRVRYLD